MGILTKELDKIVAKQEKVVAEIAIELFNELVEATPVGDPSLWKNPDSAPTGYAGGSLKAAWDIEKKGNDWVISNPTQYAEIRLSPYTPDGKFGSKQYPAGIQPILNKYNRKIESELKKI